jgi:adenylate cyclase
MGDGALVEFASAVDAVRCAVAVQDDLAEREAGVAEETALTMRLGINLGDIIIEGDDIYGDGVNLAARLEGLAEPGGICLSASVHEQVRHKLDFGFEDLGEQSVKNIAEPVRVYRVVPKAPVGERGLPLPDKPSIAVLPFQNMSGDTEQEYFADGVAEDIITGLSRIRWFFVIARNSSFTYKGTAVDVKLVGRELGVQYVLEGSVRKAGNRVRITAQLIDATTGQHVWAERYDRELEDIFALQDEITETIVAAIEPELSAVERERARRKPPESLDAWDLYQRGLWHMYRFAKEDNLEAQRLFRRSIEIDPNFASTHAHLAYTLHIAAIMDFDEQGSESLDKALSAGREAVALDEKDAMGHAFLARVYAMRREHDLAIEEAEIAIDLNPSLAQAYFGLGFALTFSGRMEEAITQLEKATRLSPHDPNLWSFVVVRGWAHILMRQFEDAAFWSRKAVRMPNTQFWTQATLASALGHLGRSEEAQRAVADLYRVKPDFSLALVADILPFAESGHRELFLDGLRKAGLPEGARGDG